MGKWYLKTVDTLSSYVLYRNMLLKEKKHIQKAFGEQIRCQRKSRGITQEELANLSNLDRSYVGGVERGDRNISLINIYKIAYALKLTPKDLFPEGKINGSD